MTFSHRVTYDRRLATHNTWRMSETPGAIDVRIRVASGPDVTVEAVRLRFRNGKESGVYHCRQIDESTFGVEGAVLDERLPRLELLLTGANPDSAAVLRGL